MELCISLERALSKLSNIIEIGPTVMRLTLVIKGRGGGTYTCTCIVNVHVLCDVLFLIGNNSVTYYELTSMYGHDTFLLDVNNVGAAMKVRSSYYGNHSVSSLLYENFPIRMLQPF